MAVIQPAERLSSNVADIHGLHNDDVVLKGINLAHEMRYLFRAMGTLGLYHTPKGWRDPNSSTFSNSLHLIHKFYCILTQMFVWFNAINLLVGVLTGDDVIVTETNFNHAFQLVAGLYTLQAAVNASIFYYICSYDYLAKCIDFWQMYCELSHSDKVVPNISCTWFRRRMWMIAATIVFTFLYCDLVGIGIAIFSSSEAVRNDTYKDGHLSGMESWIWRVSIRSISLVYISPAYFCPLIIFLIFCITFAHQYELLKQSYVKTMVSSDNIKQYLNLFRKRHQQLGKSVFLADRTFSFYLATLTCSGICMMCFSLYQLVIKDNLSIGGVHLSTTLLIYTIFLTILYVVVSISAALVHDNVSIEEFNSLNSNSFPLYIQTIKIYTNDSFEIRFMSVITNKFEPSKNYLT